ncbi:MAG: hypothetical protein JO255_07510 [Alphaproteobacteria bacterium]|nr:hypothetical protein [Alphaproteobacteria bacterium]
MSGLPTVATTSAASVAIETSSAADPMLNVSHDAAEDATILTISSMASST